MARRRQRRWAEQISQALEVPSDALLDVSRVTVVGTGHVVVENHSGLLGYFPHQVVLRVPEGQLVIAGEELVIGRIDTAEVILTGKVAFVRYQSADEPQ